MKYILKTLNDEVKQSNDINALNDACIYYKRMLSFMEALPTAKNKDFYNMLVKMCYAEMDDPSVEDELTPERIAQDTEFVRNNVTEYYKIIYDILNNQQTRAQ
ncbi:MAG: hypothetical protein IKR57_02185 [Bacilli bacterium]|nr:hypothetical protein [Bacilli bacterium]